MRFVNIEMKNFGAYEEGSLSLHDQGVKAIVAERDDSSAFDSNGSGKSTLFNALYWALFGELPSKAPAHEVVRRGAKGGCAVSLDAVTDDGQPLEIVRSKGSGKRGANAVSIRLDGEDITPKGRGEPEKLIEKLLGTSRSAFGYAAFFGSSEVFRFSAATDASRKDILSQMLQFEMWDEALAAAKAEAKALESAVTSNAASAASYRSQMEDIESRIVQETARIGREGQVIDGRLRVIEEDLAVARGHVTLTDELLEKKAKADALIKEKDAAIQEINQWVDAKQNKAQRRGIEAEAEKSAAHTALHTLSQDTCPTCGGPLTIENRDENIAKHTHIIEEAEAKVAAAQKDAEWARNQGLAALAPLNEDKVAIVKMGALLDTSIRKAQAAADAVRNLEEQVRSLKVAKDNLRSGINQLEQQRAVADEAIVTFDALVEEKTDAFNLAKFWVDGFGKKGIPAWLLDEVVPFLEERTNTYLTTLTDGAIVADFGTQVEGSKKVLEKLDISVLKDGQRAHVGTLSGGERRRFDLAVSFALHDLLTQRGVKSSCLFLDEVFDTLDETGSERVVEVIHQKRKFSGVETVFVISHSQRVVEAFPERITVKHRNGVSWLAEN